MSKKKKQRSFLVIGSGGREHAMAYKLSSARDEPVVYVAPGNDGIAADDSIRGGCVDIGALDLEALADFAAEHDVSATIVGPEAPLCAGVVDLFRSRGLPIFGPSRDAAMLEASKGFAKEIMDAAGVPTAAWARFEELDGALGYVRERAHPLVIKADGLAAGKGVVISATLEDSEQTLRDFMAEARFGAAGAAVVIEEFLEGVELSFMVVTDGESITPLSTSQDHKRLLEQDLGPNTGGMGAFTPSPHATLELEFEVMDLVIRPVLAKLAERGVAYTGFLYAGLMLTDEGPKVLEFNVRLGDPETQAILTAMREDFGAVVLAAIDGRLDEAPFLSSERCAFTVVCASRGYPLAAEKGFPISGLEQADALDGVKVFHAGTKLVDGELVNHGGRVLGVTAAGASLFEARELAYRAVEFIDWEGMHVRFDMGAAFSPPVSEEE